MLLAISQHSVLDFFGDEMPDLTDRGYLDADPVTLETSIPGIYAGGDVGTSGPSSIVKAAADGKAIAAAISAADRPEPEIHRPPSDRVGLLARRAHREFRVPVPHVPVAEREGFDPVVLTYSEEEARVEASRCLDCHQICSVCVGVCPNLAILTYESEPVRAEVPVLQVAGGRVDQIGTVAHRVDQALQVAVLTDFCNECGNCATFCPTAGEPYRDKPRLFLDRGAFENEDDNAFMVFRNANGWSVECRVGGETHRLEVNGQVSYETPRLTVRLDPATWEVLEASGSGEGEATLAAAADMYALGAGLAASAGHLPGAGDGLGTRVSHPGYGG
jgi:putative selenate reductase